jgi:hypothetical protein
MSIPVTAPDQALFDAAVVVPVLLVELYFGDGTLYLTNWPITLPGIGGHDYIGLGNMGDVGDLHENLSGAEERLVLSLSSVNSSVLALALGNVENYQNKDAVIKILMLHRDTFTPASAPYLRFAGFMDLVKVDAAGEDGTIKLECRTGGYAVRSNPSTLVLSHLQHQERHPGELGLQYVQQLIEQPTVWLSKKFQSSQI